jgi:hypothetical protein
MHQFDPSIPGFIEGDITNVAVNETPPFGLANHVVNRAEPFDVVVEWSVSGVLTQLWLAALAFGGVTQWLVRVYAESQGEGPEILLGSALVDSEPAVPGDKNYTATITVPANILSEDQFPAGDVSGIYKLTVSAFLNSTFVGAPGYDMMGFSDAPFIQVENPV